MFVPARLCVSAAQTSGFSGVGSASDAARLSMAKKRRRLIDRVRGSVERWPGVSDWPGCHPMNQRSIAQRLYSNMPSKDANKQHVGVKTGKIFTVKAKRVTRRKTGCCCPEQRGPCGERAGVTAIRRNRSRN
jgi:hypothetical protein